MDRPSAQAQAQAHPHSRHYPSHSKPIHYNRVPIGGPDRPPVTQLSSPGTIYASPSGGRESSSSSYPVPSNGSPKRELGSPGIKRESGPRDDSDQAADRSSVVTRRSSTEYPDVCNDELKPEDAVGEPQRKKQKRNKPTLSCFECVERKTKVSVFSPVHSSPTPPPTRSALLQVLFLPAWPDQNVTTSHSTTSTWLFLAPFIMA